MERPVVKRVLAGCRETIKEMGIDIDDIVVECGMEEIRIERKDVPYQDLFRIVFYRWLSKTAIPVYQYFGIEGMHKSIILMQIAYNKNGANLTLPN